MLDKDGKRQKNSYGRFTYQCCINTELNSTNFLIGGEGKSNYLIDWEKRYLEIRHRIWDISLHDNDVLENGCDIEGRRDRKFSE